MRIDKVKLITADNCGKPKWHPAGLVLAEKEKFLKSTLSHKKCPRKQTTEPKLKIFKLVTMRTDKVKWITARTCAS